MLRGNGNAVRQKQLCSAALSLQRQARSMPLRCTGAAARPRTPGAGQRSTPRCAHHTKRINDA
jgi:hypothetical protein